MEKRKRRRAKRQTDGKERKNTGGGKNEDGDVRVRHEQVDLMIKPSSL